MKKFKGWLDAMGYRFFDFVFIWFNYDPVNFKDTLQFTELKDAALMLPL